MADSDTNLPVVEDEADLMPVIPDKRARQSAPGEAADIPESETPIAIHRVGQDAPRPVPAPYARRLPATTAKEGSLLPMYLGAIATVVVVLALGFTSLKTSSVYTANIMKKTGTAPLAAAAADALGRVGDFLEKKLTHELVYERAGD